MCPKATILCYLSEDFTGGKTTFYSSKGGVVLEVTPQKGFFVQNSFIGSLLIFPQTMLYEEAVVNSGTKYVLRVDAIYQEKPKPKEALSYYSYCSLQ